MGAGAPTVLSDWFMHADACKPQPGCGWCRGAMRAQMRRLSGCADSKGGGARAACSARGDAEMNAGRRVTRRRGNQVDEGVAQGHEQAERQVRRSYSSPPEGGEFDPPTPILRWAARCACGLRPAPRALLRVGRAAPRPPGLRPLVCPSAHGHPAASVSQQEGLRGTGAPGGRGGQRAALSTPDAQPLPSPQGDFSKKAPQGREAGRGLGGRAPPGREAVGNPAQAVGGQGAAAGCARRPRTGRGCPRATGPQDAAVEAVLAVPHSAYYVQSEKQRAANPQKT